ncbi:MAG: hypothetical protein Q9219_003482 [cf. Caloplaca sp. 3 TL-2023]
METLCHAALDRYAQLSMSDSVLKKTQIDSPYAVFWIVAFLGLFILPLSTASRQRPIVSQEEKLDETGNLRRYREIRARRNQHETAANLATLIEEDGAGAWPPKANHESWPAALKPYKDIYLECVPLLPSADPSTDDTVNQERRGKYRSLMQKLLIERIDVVEVERIMKAVENGDWHVCPRDAYNAIYRCIAVCRHAYRWGTIPVVKVAQLEEIVEFPHALNVPWPYLQRQFGVEADSGNNTANVLHNFNEEGERIYKINVGMSNVITSSEDTFFRMFYDLEVLANIYSEAGEAEMCLRHLESITFRVRHLLMIFYQNLTESRVSHSIWLSYIQGFQGWGVGRMIDGEYVKYDGLSGNHVLFFQALDAFLGMDRYLSDQNMDRYIPVHQRELCLSLKKHCIREKWGGEKGALIEEELKKIVNHLKVFRAAHRARVMPYLEQPAPERLTMTAGKSVLETASTKNTKEALKVLDDMLVVRLSQTV